MKACSVRPGLYVRKLTETRIAAVVADDRVSAFYGAELSASLAAAGFDSRIFTFPSGEASKNLGTVGEILGFFADCGLERGDIVIALGGGVTGDLAGFASAVYMRGVPYVGIPTTLLSAVDSSVR